MTEDRPTATVLIVPRERVSTTTLTLTDVLAKTPKDVPVVCVDSGHSRADRMRLAGLADERTTFVRAPRWRSPNEARNLALPHATGKYVVYVDNDVLVKPGYFEALIECAEETGASVVGPLVLKGGWDVAHVHLAGGTLEWEEKDGERQLIEIRDLALSDPADVMGTLQRRRTDMAELHCVLVRRDVLDRLGGWDERLLSTHEEIDLSLGAVADGGEVWFEPSSLVTYVTPPPMTLRDRPYYLLRRCERWNKVSLDHFEQKWDAKISPLHTRWLRKHRFRAFLPLLAPFERVFGEDHAEGLRVWFFTPMETALNRLLGAILIRLRP